MVCLFPGVAKLVIWTCSNVLGSLRRIERAQSMQSQVGQVYGPTGKLVPTRNASVSSELHKVPIPFPPRRTSFLSSIVACKGRNYMKPSDAIDG